MDYGPFQKYALKYGYENAQVASPFNWDQLHKDVKQLIISYINDKDINCVSREFCKLYYSRFSRTELIRMVMEPWTRSPIELIIISKLINPKLLNVECQIVYWSLQWYIGKGMYRNEWYADSILSMSGAGAYLDNSYLKYIKDRVDLTIVSFKPGVYIKRHIVTNYLENIIRNKLLYQSRDVEWITILELDPSEVIKKCQTCYRILYYIAQAYDLKVDNEIALKCMNDGVDPKNILQIMASEPTQQQLNSLLLKTSVSVALKLMKEEPFRSNLDTRIETIKVYSMILDYVPLEMEIAKTFPHLRQYILNICSLDNLLGWDNLSLNLFLETLKHRWPDKFKEMAPSYINDKLGKYLTYSGHGPWVFDEIFRDLDFKSYAPQVAKIMVRSSNIRLSGDYGLSLNYYLFLDSPRNHDKPEIIREILTRQEPAHLDKLFLLYKNKQSELENHIKSFLN